ncbi:MAG: murein biosynthesis integral membrane protein MurJ [Nitrospinota bacterium]
MTQTPSTPSQPPIETDPVASGAGAPNSGQGGLARSAGPISAATFMSRILGFVRDVLIARAFGSGLVTDAFFVAFAIPSMFRRLLTEGALTSAFIPVHSDVRAEKGERAARAFSGAMAVSLAAFLAVFCLLGIYYARPLVALLAPGFSADPKKLGLTADLTRIMFPFLFFIGLSAIAVGVLNAARRFFLPALAPVIQNVAMIGALVAAGAYAVGGGAVYWLAWGVVLGGAFQLIVHFPLMAKLGVTPLPSLPWRVPSVGRCLSLMGPAAFGAAILQVNVLIDRWLASFLQEGSISYLYYANRLVQFPHGILSVAVAAAAFPLLADRAAIGRHGGTDDPGGSPGPLAEAGRLTLFITLPAAFGLMALAQPIMEILFERGAFGAADTAASAAALRAYALGLVFFGLVRILVVAYHARLDTKYPVRCANWSVLANVALSVTLMIPFGYVGLALATSIASGLNAWLLFRGLGGSAEWPREDLGRAIKSLLPISLLMGGLVYAGNALIWPVSGVIWLRAGILCAEVILGIGVYLLLSWLFVPELKGMLRAIPRKA